MFRYNFRQYGNAELNKAMDAAAKAKVGLIAMKTQGSSVSFEDKWEKWVADGKWSKPQAVLKAVWADDRITAAVSHMDTLEKLKENVAAALGCVLQRPASGARKDGCHRCDAGHYLGTGGHRPSGLDRE
jgi:hypothetical protein